MQDNFNLAKYLRHGNKLLNENIGGYVDLRPINSLNEAPMGDDVMTIELDMSWEPQFDAYAKQSFDDFNIQVKETNNPGTYEVTGRKEDILGYLRSEFYEMDEESIQQYYPELLDGGANDSMSLEELMGTAMEIEELEKPKSIYATDDYEDEKGFDVSGDDEVLSQEWEERFFGLGGNEVVRGIKYLVDDGFELDDIIKFLKNNEL